jgi:hypothetical protein
MVGLDQIVRRPDQRNDLKPSFFDYMAQAGVTLRELEGRVDEVFAQIPPEVRNGRTDHIEQCFDVATGISGGSLLASAMISGVPLVELVRECLTFPVQYYFQPDMKEYWRGVKSLPLVPFRLARIFTDDMRRGFGAEAAAEFKRRGRGHLPLLHRYSRLACELVTAFQEVMPRGFFTGEGIERYIEELSARYGLANDFAAVRERGKYLFIIAERFNAVDHLSSPSDQATAIYFGMPPYDTLPISKAIRASCSIPGITTPFNFVDHARGGAVYSLADGAIGKTIGRKRITEELPIACLVTINPIVPYNGPLNNMFDCLEQLYRKLIYSRLKAVENHLAPTVVDTTIHLESRPDDFFYNMLRLDKMKEGIFEGYYQTLKYCAENYVMISDRLKLGDLTMIPRTEIFRLVTNSSTVRERAYVLRGQRLERGSFRRRLGGAISSALTGWETPLDDREEELDEVTRTS